MVYRVPLTWTDRELKEAFLPHGDIVSVSLAPKSDGETGHRRFGDVTYRHASSLAELLKCATLGFDRKTGREQYELQFQILNNQLLQEVYGFTKICLLESLDL